MLYDVAVVGAGPAGAAAARSAALTGAHTVLLEREALPRYKRCGGGLIGASQQAVRQAGVALAPLIKDDVGRITFTAQGGRTFHRQAAAFLPMVLRAELDAALVELALTAGAELRTGLSVQAYEQADGAVTLRTTSGPITARAVVGADGSSGRAAAHVGVTFGQVDLGMEAELPMPAGTAWTGHALLDWGPVPGSYGWVFPKGETLTVGVIGDRNQGPAVRNYYADFFRRLHLDRGAALHDGGHLTRVRSPSSPLRRGRVLVAGDAAGLLDPWTREGISYALRSGALAGAAAAGDLAAYEADVLAALGADMAAGSRAMSVFTRHPDAVHNVFHYLPGMWNLFVRLVSGETTMAKQLERKSIRGLVALLGG